MDETSLRGLLETALSDEPAIGPVARNSLRAGIKLRRRARIRRAAGGTAVVIAVAAVIPAATGVFGNTAAGPQPGTAHKGPARPHHVAAPTGTAYVINSGGGTVTPINVATNTAGKPISVSGEPVAMAVAPDGKTAYIASGATNGGPLPTSAQSMIPIDLATGTPGKPIDLQYPPDEIVITPDGKTAYIINGFPSTTLTPVDLATNTPGKPIKLSVEPEAIAMAPDGKSAYMTVATGTGTPANFRPVYDFVPIDLATYKLGKPVKLSGLPEAFAIAPDGKTAYVTSYSSGTVTPIDLTTDRAGKPIKISGKLGADAIAITPDGSAAYVANQPSSTVTPIDLATGKPGKPIEIGHGWDSGFEAIAIVP